MRKKGIILCITASITILTITASIIITHKANNRKNTVYTLKSNGNHIALYKGKTQIEVYEDTDIRLLTDYDRYLLRNGIEIIDKEHLITILQDYS